MSEERELTFGEKAVGLTFNPSGDPVVLCMKQEFAACIDRLHNCRLAARDQETARMYSVAITETQTAQMWAVKAATWRA